jgi:hypothetical protein
LLRWTPSVVVEREVTPLSRLVAVSSAVLFDHGLAHDGSVAWADLQPPQVLVAQHGTGAAALGEATSVVRNVLAHVS